MSSKRALQQEKQDEACSHEEPCSSSSIPAQAQKRARYSDSAEQQVPGEEGPEQQQQHLAGTVVDFSCASPTQVERFRHCQQVLRPGIPNPIRLSAFKLADKPSPPLRGDDKVRRVHVAVLGALAHAFVQLAANKGAACLQEGHYNYELGENISSRYKILSKFGEGTFGRVLECWDRNYKDYVAVKIVRNVDKYRHAAMIELRGWLQHR
eukprot:GHRQ01028205.1.p1 GENE.GHRQ01028205.1~~GHRQ01028205.1.p1  ORF type:complete len:209 (+),score=58.14 GHRQ01028205.1:980-1606(+)